MAGKRTFYADDEETITKPGFNSRISEELKEQESAHGSISFIEGMGIRSIPILEKYSNQFRLFLHDKIEIYSAELGTQRSAFNNELNTVKKNFNEIITEPILPSFIYILTASLTGSILVNKRVLPIRFITPLLFGGAAFKYYMPKSFENASTRLLTIEEKNYPELHKQQIEFKNQYSQLKKDFNKSLGDSEIELQKNIHSTRESIIDFFSSNEKK